MTTADDLARAVAADLGPDVEAAVATPPADDKTRAFGITEAMATGGFLVQCAQVAVQMWQAKQDRALLVAALANSEQLMAAYPRLDPEKRLGLVARMLRKMLPSLFGAPQHQRRSSSVAERQRWILDYIESRAATREFVGGATLLMPFADQDYWIVYQPIGWIPDTNDGPGVIRADVERGFITDFASVPSYLWGILQRTGKYGNAAIYHDWLYWKQDELPGNSRAVADRVFDRAMNDMGVDAVTRNLMWAAVRVFGGEYWDETAKSKATGEKRVLKRFPDRADVTWEEWRKKPDVFA
jgi:Protein of unknown function (DUF1353)